MKTIIIEEDILVYCVSASSFPEGVKQAHETLHSYIPFSSQRKYFGLSWPGEDGSIIYKAAAEELQEGELSNRKLETKTIAKGKYLGIDIPDFMNHIPAIGVAFQELIHNDEIDRNGFCIEWYMADDLCRCMVKTISN